MAPAPLCKTAIVRFLIGEETFQKLWNLSSNMRKRLQMVLKEMEITVREYSDKILKIKEWVKVAEHLKSVESVEEIKKGVCNYELKTQEEIDKVIALNGKLRCYEICFLPAAPLEVDYLQYLKIFPFEFDFYSSCSFNKIERLEFERLLPDQIKYITSRVKRVKHLKSYKSIISDLDLNSLGVRTIQFEFTIFKGEVKLPFCLDELKILKCGNHHLLNLHRANKIDIVGNDSQDVLYLVKRLKGVKEANISEFCSELMNSLPNSVRKLHNQNDSGRIDFEEVKNKFPLLIKIFDYVPIEAAQTLNLRSVELIMRETEIKFTLRPREIIVCSGNVEQLNEHPELFERVEKVQIRTNKFNYDCLPGKMKQIYLGDFLVEEEKLDNLKMNNWKFEGAVVDLSGLNVWDVKTILDSLRKVKKIRLSTNSTISEKLIKEYPQFSLINK